MIRYYLLFSAVIAVIFAMWDSASETGDAYPVPLGFVNCVVSTGYLYGCTEVSLERANGATEADLQEGFPG